ncbi:histidine kinase [Rhizosphaericola mali]|nr:histidine kinase [Rhizosphaericola mali]
MFDGKFLFHIKNLFFYFNILIYFIGLSITAKLTKDYYLSEKETRTLSQWRNRSEIDYLKNQIRPHFLFNALNTIYGLSLQQEDANEKILDLSEILRYYVYSTQKIIPVKEFTHILKVLNTTNYLSNEIKTENFLIAKKETFPILNYLLQNINKDSNIKIAMTMDHIKCSINDTHHWNIPLKNDY